MWEVGRPAFRWSQAKLQAVIPAKRAFGLRELESRTVQSPSFVEVVKNKGEDTKPLP